MPRKLLEKDFNPENLIGIIGRDFKENYFSSSEILNKIDSDVETRTGKEGKKRSLASLNDQLKKMCSPNSDLLERTGKGKNIRYRIYLIPVLKIEKFIRTLNCKKEYSKNEINKLIKQYQKKLSPKKDDGNAKKESFNNMDFWNYFKSKMFIIETDKGTYKITNLAIDNLKFCRICGNSIKSSEKIIAMDIPPADEDYCIELKTEFAHASCYGQHVIVISPFYISKENNFRNGSDIILDNNGLCYRCGLPLTPLPSLLSLLTLNDFISILTNKEFNKFMDMYRDEDGDFEFYHRFILNPLIRSQIEHIIMGIHIDKINKNYKYILKRTEEIYNELKCIYENKKKEILTVYKKLSGDEIMVLMQQPPYSMYTKTGSYNTEIHSGDLSYCCLDEDNFQMMHPKCAGEKLGGK